MSALSDAPSQHVGHVDAVNLTVSLCLCYTLCIALVRLWIRRGAFGIDDLVVAVATLFTLGHTGSTYAGLSAGLGKPWVDIEGSKELSKLNAASIAGVVTFIIALYISKIGVIAFLMRITKNRTQVIIYYACCFAITLLGFISILIVTAGCPSPSGYYWAFFANRSQCDTQATRWQVLTALDIITEIGLLVMPIHLVWGLQMPKTKKFVLIIAFYLRLPVIGLSIGRNAYTHRLHSTSTDAGLDSAIVTIWLEVQLTYALAASTLSALKAFTESFETGFGLGFARGKTENGSYALSGVTGSTNGTTNTITSHNRPDEHPIAGPSTSKPQTNTSLDRIKTIKYEDTARRTASPRPLSPASRTSSTRPLRLRPDLTTRATAATATATASATSETGTAPWLHGGASHNSVSSDAGSSRDVEITRNEPLVIMRETELSVTREAAPWLGEVREGGSRR